MPSIVWKGKADLFTGGVNTVLVEQPDSPEYVLGERVTCVRRYRGLHSLCVSSALAKGTLGSGSMSGYIVTQSVVKRLPKQIGELVISYEANASGSGQQLPPDEYSLKPFEVNPRIESHPAFSTLDEDDQEKVRAWIDAPDPATKAKLKLLVTDATAQLLGQKRLKGIETYYLAGWTYTWSLYSWTIPTLVDGGYIETPSGPLSGYLGSGLDWLRQADDLDYNGTHYKLTRAWLAGPSGHWDADLYS